MYRAKKQLADVKLAVESLDTKQGTTGAAADVDGLRASQLRYIGEALGVLNSLIGEVQADPTQNTLLDRLKDLLTGLVIAAGSNVIGKVNANLTQSSTEFLASAWGSAIGEGATADTLATSLGLDVSDVMGEVLITLEGDVENVAFDAYVDATFVVSYDGTDYDDGEYQKLSFNFDGSNTTRRRSIPLNISAASTIKLFSVKNNDTTYDLVTDKLNVYLAKKL